LLEREADEVRSCVKRGAKEGVCLRTFELKVSYYGDVLLHESFDGEKCRRRDILETGTEYGC
jgi:hypothetical protein